MMLCRKCGSKSNVVVWPKGNLSELNDVKSTMESEESVADIKIY